MDTASDLLRQAKAAQRRAEQAGSPNTASVLARIAGMVADLMAGEAGMDQGGALPLAGALPRSRRARR